MFKSIWSVGIAVALVLGVAGCGDDGEPPPPPAPTLTNVAPTEGPAAGGTSLSLTGTNFIAGATVSVGGTFATSVVVVDATTITCDTPAGAAGAVVDVTVTTTDGSATLADAFTYFAAPTLTAVAPPSGLTDGGTSVTLTGTGFTANAAGTNTVTFGGTPATNIVAVDDATITCDTPAGAAGPVDVIVTNENGSATLTAGFTYNLPPANVLLAHSIHDIYVTDIVDKLTAFGTFATVDSFDAGDTTPTIEELEAYDAVLVVSDGIWNDSVLFGDRLADFIDGGGAVVLGMFSMSSPGLDTPEGRFTTDNYFAIGTSVNNGTFSNGGITVVDASHPILTNVTTFGGGSASYAPEGSVLGPDAHLIATWDDPASTPLIASRVINGTRRADLGFFPPTQDSGPAEFVDPATDAMLIVANALNWVSKRL